MQERTREKAAFYHQLSKCYPIIRCSAFTLPQRQWHRRVFSEWNIPVKNQMSHISRKVASWGSPVGRLGTVAWLSLERDHEREAVQVQSLPMGTLHPTSVIKIL